MGEFGWPPGAKQRDVVISGIRITFAEVQPYSIRYTIEDVQH